MTRLISLLHERQTGCTNGGQPGLPRLSAAAPLVQAGVLLVLTLTLMEPASATGLDWWQRAGFFAAHVAPAMVVAWFASGWLFNQGGLQRSPAWLLLALAGAVAGVVLAPWSVLLELWLGVVDLDEPGAQPAPLTWTAWRSELRDELLQVPPRTALFWLAMNLWALWRAQQPPGATGAAPAGPGPGCLPDAPGTGPARGAEPPAPANGSGAHAAPDVPPVNVSDPGSASFSSPPAPAPTPTPTPAACVPDPLPGPGATAAADPAPGTSPPGTALLDRLPARLGRDLVQLEAQQHYLRVVTTRGEHLLLHGLAPAVAELARQGIAGMQVHRSLWVAWAHVERLDLRPGSPAVVLRDGRRLPIGRRRLRAVAEAWQQWPGA